MKLPSINSQIPKRNLLLSAILLFIASIVSSYYFRINPSIHNEQRLLQNYVNDQQKDYEQLIHDSLLMRKLVQKSETLGEFKELQSRKYGIFLFAETLSDRNDLLFLE